MRLPPIHRWVSLCNECMHYFWSAAPPLTFPAATAAAAAAWAAVAVWRWLRARPTNAPGGNGRARQRACRVVRICAVQTAERGAECSRRLGERGAVLKGRERGGQVGRRARRR